jgi:monoamine oxidase
MPPSVIVVGAGLAGLAAAERLRRRRIPVTILEGRDRVGGRVWTLRDGFVGNVRAEAGGEFVDEGQDAIRALAEEAGLRPVRVLKSGFGEARRSPGGRVRLRPSPPWREWGEKLQPLAEAFQRGDERRDGPVARAIARRSVAEFARSEGGSGKTLAWLRGLYCADVEDLSLLVVVEQAAAAKKAPGRQKMYRIAGGADRLAERLARPLRIHLETRVVAISQSARGVRVKVRGEELAADYVIVTAPAPLVNEIAFHPRLPEDQRKAIAQLKYGPATKTHLQFDRPFWRRSGRPRAFATSLPIGAVWDGSETQGGALLTLLAGGGASAATRSMLSRGGPERLMRELKWLGSGRLLSCQSVTWEADPWARGAYAYFDPSYDPGWRSLLARPFGRVLFAGEHTSLAWQGFMNGAIESGQRAADEVLAITGRLNVKPARPRKK